MSPAELTAWGSLISAVLGGVLLVVRELRRGRAEKADPDRDGSGAAICKELRAMHREQSSFNAALALHMGMALPRGAKAQSNGR